MNISEMGGHRRLRQAINATLLSATLAGGIAACAPEKFDPGYNFAQLRIRQTSGNSSEPSGPLSVDQNTEVCGSGKYIKFNDAGTEAQNTHYMEMHSGGAEGATVAQLTEDLQDSFGFDTPPAGVEQSVIIWEDDGQHAAHLKEALQDATILYGNSGVMIETFMCEDIDTLPQDHPYRIQQATPDAGNLPPRHTRSR